MSNKMSEEAALQLTRDVKKILRLASRKRGATSDDICNALKNWDVTSYRHRNVIRVCKNHGMFLDGSGYSGVWRMMLSRSQSV